jgi:drug/metabolite transporter (DMT)-like permease
MPFYIFAWTASILYGLYSVVAKLIGKYKLKNTYQFSFFATLFSGIIMALISYINGGRIALNWTYILLAAIFLSVGNVLYLKALKVLDVSVISPLFNIRVAITVLLGFLVLGENIAIRSLIIILIIFIAGFFTSMDEKFSLKSFFTKNIGLGLIFMLVLSVHSILINRAIYQTNYWTAMLWTSLMAIVFSFIFLYPKFKNDLRQTQLKDYLGVGLLAIIGAIGDLAAFKAFQSNVGLSSVIISLPVSMIIVFILSIWKPSLLEKHTIKVYAVRFISAGIMIWGALQLK